MFFPGFLRSTSPGLAALVAVLSLLHARVDAAPQLFWQNELGEIVVWHTKAGRVTSTEALYENRYRFDPARSKADYQVVAAADFDGDGQSDLLWLAPSREVVVWLMRSGFLRHEVPLGFSLPADEEVRGAGDVNGDGRADWFTQDAAGAIYVRLIDGSLGPGSRTQLNASPAYSGELLAVGDFNADGRSDLLLGASGHPTGVRLLDGASDAGGVVITGYSADAPFVGAQDFDGNGVTDLLVQAGGGALEARLLRFTGSPGLAEVFGTITLQDELGGGVPRSTPGAGFELAACASLGHHPFYETTTRPPALDDTTPGYLRQIRPFRNVKDFGAVGDGVADDTAAIQNAIDFTIDHTQGGVIADRGPAVVYFPAGTYRVTNTLVAWMQTSLVGDFTAPPVIELAPAAPGFANPSRRKPLIVTTLGYGVNPGEKDSFHGVGQWWAPAQIQGSSNNNFHVQIRHLTLRIGAGNPGAVGILSKAAQGSAIRDVKVETGDGAVGMDAVGNLSYGVIADYKAAVSLVDAIYLPASNAIKADFIANLMATGKTRPQAEQAFFAQRNNPVAPPFKALFDGARAAVADPLDPIRHFASDPNRIVTQWGGPDGGGLHIEDCAVEGGVIGIDAGPGRLLRSVFVKGQTSIGVQAAITTLTVAGGRILDCPLAMQIFYQSTLSLVDSEIGPLSTPGSAGSVGVRLIGTSCYVENTAFDRVETAVGNHLAGYAYPGSPFAAYSLAGDAGARLVVASAFAPAYDATHFSYSHPIGEYLPFGSVNGVDQAFGNLPAPSVPREPVPQRPRPSPDDDSIVNVLDLELLSGGEVGPVKGNGELDGPAQAAMNRSALQWAIDRYRTVFLPYGVYSIDDTLQLRADTRLIGENHSIIQLLWNAPGFGNPNAPKAVIATPDDPGGSAQLVDLMVRGGPYPGSSYTPHDLHRGAILIDWKTGRNSGVWDVTGSVAYNDPVKHLLRVTGSGGGVFSDLWLATGIQVGALAPYATAVSFYADSPGPAWYFGVASEHTKAAGYHLRGASDHSFFYPQTEASVVSMLIENSRRIRIYTAAFGQFPGFYPVQKWLPIMRVRHSNEIYLYSVLSRDGLADLVIDNAQRYRSHTFGYLHPEYQGALRPRTVAAFVEDRPEIPTAPLDYAAWISRFAVGAATGPLDNPANDGMRNILKYAIDADPTKFVPAPSPEYYGQPKLAIEYPANPDAVAHGIEFGIEASPDLVDWTDVPLTPANTWHAPMIQRTEVGIPANAARRFLRLRAHSAGP